jgi:hypothetical protein
MKICALLLCLFAGSAIAATTPAAPKPGAVAPKAVAKAAAATPTPSAALSWTAPTTNTDGTAITATLTYNIYQGLTGALAKVQSGVTTTAATITAGLTAGTTQCFAVTAVANGVESAQSNSACAAISQPSPNSPTTVVVVITGS